MLTRGQPRTTVGVTAAASEAHWRTIYGNTRQWKPDEDLVSWMNDMQQTIPAQQLDPIKDHKIWCNVLRKAKSWKAPGPDGIPNFFWRNLPTARKVLFRWTVWSKNHKSVIPAWLPKDE
uniref:Reverse transcriptase zinc-binding domain-containing protein n=1 Tax=Ditylenchus dipsaci TaxID=166011 RepID=A0A915EUE5_9BILA